MLEIDEKILAVFNSAFSFPDEGYTAVVHYTGGKTETLTMSQFREMFKAGDKVEMLGFEVVEAE